MLLNDEQWPDSIETDLEPVPIPKLQPSRILHRRQKILPHISHDALPWWNTFAPEEIANQQLERLNIENQSGRKKKRIGSASAK